MRWTMHLDQLDRPQAPRGFWRALFTSPWTAALVFLVLAALARSGLEKQAMPTTHDDHYFLLRSESYDIRGSHLAFIKEYPYALFVQVSRRLGFSLGDFELLIYVLALVVLWKQLARFLGSHPVAWGAVLPLTVLPYVRIVLQRATYDNLQLILTPLVLAAALAIVRRRGDRWAILGAGAVGTLQWATRPDGLLLLIPLLWALLWVGWLQWDASQWRAAVTRTGGRIVLLLALCALLPAGFSLYNAHAYGFRAQTIMKSGPMDEAISLMMQVAPDGEDGGRYAPFPMASMERALEVSPALRRAEPFLRRNTGGVGWSNGSVGRFRPTDGSISGAHFQWAWLDASAEVVGSTTVEIINYQREVAEELRTAFARGELERRRVLTTAFGPHFSIFDRAYWQSTWILLRILLHVEDPQPPVRAFDWYDDLLDQDYDRLALRKRALVVPMEWSRRGWIIGLEPHERPRLIELDAVAREQGVQFEWLERVDVVRQVLGLDSPSPEEALVGFRVSTAIDQMDGHLRVVFEEREVLLPLQFLYGANVARAWGYEDLFIHLEGGVGGSLPRESRRDFNRLLAFNQGLNGVARLFIWSAPLFLMCLLLGRSQWRSRESEGPQVLFLFTLFLSLFGPFWALLSAIDAFMYPGNEPRYLAPAALALWFFVATLASLAARRGWQVIRANPGGIARR